MLIILQSDIKKCFVENYNKYYNHQQISDLRYEKIQEISISMYVTQLRYTKQYTVCEKMHTCVEKKKKPLA